MAIQTISLAHHLHDFTKVNLVTISKNKRTYDEYKCRKCGLVGRRYGLTETILLVGNPSNNKITNCTEEKRGSDYWLGNRVKVTKCTAQGPAFANCTPDSVHNIVSPPAGYTNGADGMWVQGVGEPVKLLYTEFTYLPGMVKKAKLTRSKFNHDVPKTKVLVRTKFKIQ